jgi:hypothetical protein
MLGVVPKDLLDHRAIKEMPATIEQSLEIGAAGADIERFVDR